MSVEGENRASDEYDYLPPQILLSEYGGDFEVFIEEAYNLFMEDFKRGNVFFRGKKVVLKRHPMRGNKEASFYHATSEGKVEDERTPDLRRCERIRWIRPIITKADEWDLKVWEQERTAKRGKATRVIIWYEGENEDGTKENYFVILDKRPDFYLLWTTFEITIKHQLRSKEKEYKRWLEAQKKRGAQD